MKNQDLKTLGRLCSIVDKNCYQVEMNNPDFTKIAEAYDLFAIRVQKMEELIPAIKKMISYQGTVILDIAIESTEEI